MKILNVRPLDGGTTGFTAEDPLSHEHSSPISPGPSPGPSPSPSFSVLPLGVSSFVPVSRFSSTSGPDACSFAHYHTLNAITTPVTDCNGIPVSDPAPGVCGFGSVADVIIISSCANP